MAFKRARTDDQIEARKAEIIRVSAELMAEGSVEAVHFKAIGEKTSFGRSTIYKYYATKEEILLDLLSDDIHQWVAEVIAFTEAYDVLTRQEFCLKLSQTYIANERLLKLMSILYGTLEKNSSLEKLVDFKANLKDCLQALTESLHKFFPGAGQRAIQEFITASTAYVLGLYPATHLTDRQMKAMALAGYEHHAVNFSNMCYQGILLLSANL